MKAMFVVAGKAPAWVVKQIRYSAQQLTEDGRVLVSFTDGFGHDLDLPGDVGATNLLGIAPSGEPIWTARTAAALGMRPQQDTTVIALFDGVRLSVAASAAALARARRERVVIHDMRRPSSTMGRVRRLGTTLVGRLAHDVVVSPPVAGGPGRSVVLAVCDDDPALAGVVVRAANSIPAESTVDWRFIIQTTDPAIDDLVDGARAADLITVVQGPVATDLLETCDVIVASEGANRSYAIGAVQNGASGVIVGQPIADRIVRRFDGVWLARHDASSLLVALESARIDVDGHARSALEVRADGDRVVAAVRSLATTGS